MSKDPKPPDPPDKPPANPELDDFFQRLPANFRWPKPNAEAVAAAVEAIQRMSGGAPVARDLMAHDLTADDLASTANFDSAISSCAACGGTLPSAARFCVWCGIPRDGSSPAANQQHVHHHYHHIVAAQGSSPVAPAAEAGAPAPRGKAPGSAGPAPGGRAETAARQVVQDWAQACNTKHIDDLLELYTADATLIRSSVPPVRSMQAIREFLLSVLEAGLGDVEMESLRFEMLGDVALDIGRCKMLVPVAMGKRREERGKYLIVLVRQPVGTWKILADCWSSDLSVSAAPVHESAPRKGSEDSPPQKRR